MKKQENTTHNEKTTQLFKTDPKIMQMILLVHKDFLKKLSLNRIPHVQGAGERLSMLSTNMEGIKKDPNPMSRDENVNV